MAKPNLPTPQPVPKDLVCSECGEQWSEHVGVAGAGKPIDLTVCIKVLRSHRAPAYQYAPTWTYPVYQSTGTGSINRIELGHNTLGTS